MSDEKKQSKQSGFRVWQLLAAICVMGTTMSLSLGKVQTPQEPDQRSYYLPSHSAGVNYKKSFERSSDDRQLIAEPTVIEVLPFNMHREVPGPLLAGILKKYLPDSTNHHADELRSTLPPSHDPRMIVILPSEDEPVF